MSPVDAAFVSEALEAVDAGADTVNMRDGHSEYWGVDELSMKLESTDHHVEWVFHNTKADRPEGAERTSLQKNAGSQDEWDDGYFFSKIPNVNGLRVGQTVAGCHVKFGLTSNPEDSSVYENGYYVGLYPDKRLVRGAKGVAEQTCGKYELNENFTVRIVRGSATILRNDEEEPFDVVGHCEEKGTSMHGMFHIKERDALGQLEGIFAVAMVNSIDINGNLLTDNGIDRLATALEVPFTKVTHLDLGLNRIRDAGAMRIADVLEKSWSAITSLVLSHNEIGDEGVARLAEALSKEGCKVTKIWLEGNQITDDGAMKIAEALELETCQLTKIELAWNKIEDEGVQRLVQAISKPECKVAEFSLDHNKCIDRKTKKMLTAVMAKVPRLVDMT